MIEESNAVELGVGSHRDVELDGTAVIDDELGCIDLAVGQELEDPVGLSFVDAVDDGFSGAGRKKRDDEEHTHPMGHQAMALGTC